jgi:AraC family transcriptional regulator
LYRNAKNIILGFIEEAYLMVNDSHQKFLSEEYSARINRVIDYIETNLDQALSLETLAGVANFSPFHFHRIFRAVVGETLGEFIQRRRIEKAASQLIYNPKKSITAIALDCGFSGSATFARAFKEMFQMSASEWRSASQQQSERKIRKIGRKEDQTVGKIRQDLTAISLYIDPVTNNPKWRIKMINKSQVQVEIKDMPTWPVAYVRHIGPYQGDSELFESLFNKLMAWAAPRGLLRFPETQILAVYYDDPEITAQAKLRVDACITVPSDTVVEGEIGKTVIPGGNYAVAHFELTAQEYQQAWDLVFGEWLPQSGYQPDDRPCYELYLNNPEEHPEHKHIVDICVPVKLM